MIAGRTGRLLVLLVLLAVLLLVLAGCEWADFGNVIQYGPLR
jgi:hypothetical protein